MDDKLRAKIEGDHHGMEAALHSLYPGTQWSINGDTLDGLVWLEPENGIPKPSKEEIQLEMDRLKSIYNDKEYRRLRSPEYPDIKDQLDMLYHDIKNGNLESGNWLQAVEAVKDKYPKP